MGEQSFRLSENYMEALNGAVSCDFRSRFFALSQSLSLSPNSAQIASEANEQKLSTGSHLEASGSPVYLSKSADVLAIILVTEQAAKVCLRLSQKIGPTFGRFNKTQSRQEKPLLTVSHTK